MLDILFVMLALVVGLELFHIIAGHFHREAIESKLDKLAGEQGIILDALTMMLNAKTAELKGKDGKDETD